MGGYDRGWFIEGGEVKELKNSKPFLGQANENSPEFETDACLERARDPEVDNGNTVYWSKEAAEAALLQQTNPVEYWWREMREGRLDPAELEPLIGTGPARRKRAKEAG
jgi:hypothetical protein